MPAARPLPADRPRISLPATLSLFTPDGLLEVDLFEAFPFGPRGALDVQARQLARADAGYARLTSGSVVLGGFRGWFLRQRVTEDGEPVEQVVVALEAGPVGVLATAPSLLFLESLLPGLLAAL